MYGAESIEELDEEEEKVLLDMLNTRYGRNNKNIKLLEVRVQLGNVGVVNTKAYNSSVETVKAGDTRSFVISN